MKRVIKICAIGVFCLSTFTCGYANQDLYVPNNLFVLLKRQENYTDKIEYAGFKFYQQSKTLEEIIKYEWISLYYGETIVKLENQNFEFGETTMVGKFGIGFEDYRFKWAPASKNGSGQISSWLQSKGKVTYCLSKRAELWGIDLANEINKLQEEGKCKK